MSPKETDNTVKREVTSIKVRPEIWKEAKITAIRQDIDLSVLVERALEKYIHDEATKSLRKQQT
jgi:hypothetical protein